MSASISSISIVSMSESGSTVPATWTTSGSSKQRTTWRIASTSRMWLRNLLPSPSPFARPLDDPGDVDELERRGDELLAATMYLLIRCQPVVGHAARSPRSARSCRTDNSPLWACFDCGEGVEQRALADVGQTDDAGFHNSTDPRKRKQ